MHKLADREIKAGRMLDNGGLMPVADGRAGARSPTASSASSTARSSRPRRSIGGYAIFELRDKEEAVAIGEGVHAAAQRPHAGLGRNLRGPRVRIAGHGSACHVDARVALRRLAAGMSAAMTAADIHRTILARLADRAAAADHQPVADAARRAAGRGPDAGSAGGRARALAGHRRAGKARRLADGDRQAPRARSSAPRPDARAQARDARAGSWSRSSRPCPISTPRSTTISATNCCG